MSYQCPQCGSIVSCMSQVGPKDDDAGLVSLGMRGHWLDMQCQIIELVKALEFVLDDDAGNILPQALEMAKAALKRAGAA